MRKIYSGSSQMVSSGTNATLHTGPGKVLGLIATCNNAAAQGCTLYDNTTNAAPALLSLQVSSAAPVVILFPVHAPLVFTTGLNLACAAGVWAFVITEAG